MGGLAGKWRWCAGKRRGVTCGWVGWWSLLGRRGGGGVDGSVVVVVVVVLAVSVVAVVDAAVDREDG